MLGASLEVYGLDGGLRATLRPAGARFVSLPIDLGSGAYRYLWRSPSGSGQGMLIRLP
jgi:hypothetical protein